MINFRIVVKKEVTIKTNKKRPKMRALFEEDLLFNLKKTYCNINVCLITFSAANRSTKNTITSNSSTTLGSILVSGNFFTPENRFFTFFI